MRKAKGRWLAREVARAFGTWEAYARALSVAARSMHRALAIFLRRDVARGVAIWAGAHREARRVERLAWKAAWKATTGSGRPKQP